MGIAISFCITVYNQTDLVKRCLDSIVAYKGNDIEIIVSDDRSTEDIRGLVDSYHDDRIRYFINDTNLGHDRNILSALSKSRGLYGFLLRSRDLIISSAIPLLVDTIRKYGNASYITGEALNQDGDLKIQYSKECFQQGDEAIEANYKLFIHPSGSMYRISAIDFEGLSSFLERNAVPKNGFVVHNMLRLQLAVKGDFVLIRKPVWIYVDTENAKDRAVNHSIGGVSVYNPSLLEKRYQYEVEYAKQILEKNHYWKAYYNLTAVYLDLVTWGFKLSNSDKNTQKHYDFEEIDFSVSKERKRFKEIYINFYNGVPEWPIYKKQMAGLFMKNKTVDALKYYVRKNTYRTPA